MFVSPPLMTRATTSGAAAPLGETTCALRLFERGFQLRDGRFGLFEAAFEIVTLQDFAELIARVVPGGF